MKKSPSKSDELLARAYALKNDSEMKALYKDWAQTYEDTMLDGLSYLTPQKTANLLCSHLENKSSKILDIGCGTGLAGKELAKLNFTNIDALDFSSEMLAVAKSHRLYTQLLEADLNKKLKIETETYDAMICTGTFTHAHVGAGCLAELFRVLKTKGLFACTVQKDLWHSAGFAEKASELEQAGIIKTLHKKLDVYYETSEQPDGWYLVWRKS